MTVNPNYNTESQDTNKTVDDNGDTTVDLYIASHGKTPRTGGPYMDDIERERAEQIRAKMEDREPDLENPPATAGTRLVPKSMLYETDVDKRHFSDTIEVVNEPVDSYVVPAESTEPDPTQANWDNDSSKIAALEGAKRFEELKGQPQPDSVKTQVETDEAPPVSQQGVNTPGDPEGPEATNPEDAVSATGEGAVNPDPADTSEPVTPDLDFTHQVDDNNENKDV